MLLIVLHALLDIGDKRFGGEGGTRLGINVELLCFADALGLKLGEDLLGIGEELWRLLVGKRLYLLNLVALNIDLHGGGTSKATDGGGQRRSIDDRRLARLCQNSLGCDETTEQQHSGCRKR